MFLLEQIDKIHLTDNNHSFLIFIHPVNEVIIIAVIHVQSLITGDYTHFRQCVRRKLKQRFGNRNVDMYRSFPMMFRFQQGFVHQTIAIPFIFFRMNLREVDRLLDQILKNTGLRQGLSIHLSDPGSRTVGRNNHQRNILIKCFRHSRMKIEQRRAGSTTDGSRFAAIQSQPNGKIARTPFIRHRITGKVRMIGQGMHERDITTTRT